MGPDEMHPRVLREMTDKLPSHPPSYFKRHGSQVKFLVAARRETLHPFLKRLERRTQRATYLSASPLCLGRS